MKECFKCNKVLSIKMFYKHKQMGDGHLNKCKECTKNDVKQKYIENIKDPEYINKERKRGREKYYRLNYKELPKPSKDKKKAIMKRYYEKYPEKKIMRRIVSSLGKPKKGFNNHHWSYNSEHSKDVIILSIKDHNLIHRFLTYNQESKMYYSKDGILLDTRIKHENYINEIIRLNPD